MKRKQAYKDSPKDIAQAIDKAKVMKDFLPSPETLVFKEDTIKITLFLNRRSVAFFKKKAQENHVPYQKMIRKAVDIYADHFQKLSA